MFINGEFVDAVSGNTFEVTNPATGQPLGEVPDGDARDAERAIAAADAAFGDWSQTTAYERADVLMAAWNLMRERADELAALMTAEQGKPLRASSFEVNYGADFIRWFAEEARRLTGEWIPSARANQRFLSIQAPVGVVGAVTPVSYTHLTLPTTPYV